MELIKSVGKNTGINEQKFYKATLFRSDALLLGVNCLEPGQVQSAHSHADQDKFYYVVEGQGSFILGDKRREGHVGEVIWAPAGLDHGVENRGEGRLTLLVGIAPAP